MILYNATNNPGLRLVPKDVQYNVWLEVRLVMPPPAHRAALMLGSQRKCERERKQAVTVKPRPPGRALARSGAAFLPLPGAFAARALRLEIWRA